MKHPLLWLLGTTTAVLAGFYIYQRNLGKEVGVPLRKVEPLIATIAAKTTKSDATNVPKDLAETYKPFLNGSFNREDIAYYGSFLPYKSITLMRTGCYGECPVYNFTVLCNGTATLQAIKYLPRLGRFEGEVDLDTYARLCYVLDRFDFQKLQKAYTATWTDDSTCVVEVETASGKKRVLDYGRVGPIELWAIQELLDKIRGQINWKEAKLAPNENIKP